MKFSVLIPDRITTDAEIEKSVFGDKAEITLCGAVNSSQIPGEVWSSTNAVLAWHEIQYDKELLLKMKNCKVIVRVGVGYDNVDLNAADELGITVCNVPDYGTDDVADHAMSLILSLSRSLHNYDKMARDKIWKWETGFALRRLKGRSVGIVGLGRIGTAVALRAKSFGLGVRFYDPYKPNGYEKSLNVERDYSLHKLASNSDIISIHAPLTKETKLMINKRFFESCRNQSIFINTARGMIVNIDDLYEAMVSNKILFAGLDVLSSEPPDENHPLIKSWIKDEDWIKGRIIITPHSAFFNQDSYKEMREKAALEALRVLNNELPLNRVNNG